jgi:alpha-amylase
MLAVCTPVLPISSVKPTKDVMAASKDNMTLMQYFEWYLPADGNHWRRLESEANNLNKAGVTGIWLPPAYKGQTINDVGYGVYDWYDLGEFDQKGGVRTKYGTKGELKSAISALKANNMQVFADIVMNHKAGADGTDQVNAIEVDRKNRNVERSGAYQITSYTRFWFPGRGSTYSSFQWNASHFNGVDYDAQSNAQKLFKFQGRSWDVEVDKENGNYDYLMFADVDFDNPDVVKEMTNWGTWLVNELDLDGFRLDAVKHIKFDFMKDWLTNIRKATGKQLFTFGEYWSGQTPLLVNYLTKVNNTMSVLDVDLHHRFEKASNGNGSYDLRQLLEGTLTDLQPNQSITFVDNHDTQPGQALQSWVKEWFKPQSYAVILTRKGGVPCLFYGDYYGIPNNNLPALKSKIDPILKARKEYAYGVQHDYFDDEDVAGWTREGETGRSLSGLATVISDGAQGSKKMFVGKQNAGEKWHDMTGNRSDIIRIGADGWGTFPVSSRSLSIYVQKEAAIQDNVLPSAPKNAIVSAKTDSSLTLNWEAATDNIGISGYEVYRNNVLQETVEGTTFTDRGLTSETSYSYRVVAIDVAGNRSTGSATVSGKTTVVTGNIITIYYKNGFAKPYIHYKRANGMWTDAPGIAMKPSEVPGYYKYVANVADASQLEAVFNDGGSKWDSNNNKNYVFKTGVSTYVPDAKSGVGTLKLGAPKPNTEPNPNPNPNPNPDPVIPVVPASMVTIYYKKGFAIPHIHYRPNDGSWTDVPGVPMPVSEVEGYHKISVDIGSADGLTACFNNGSGIWDSNSSKNYLFNKGVYTFVPSTSGGAGKIVSGAPGITGGAGTTTPTTPGTSGSTRDVVLVIGNKIFVNGKQLNTPLQPRRVNGRIVVPFKVLFESFGVNVNWSLRTKSLTASKSGLELSMQVGSRTARVNGKAILLDAAPTIIRDTTFVPLRFVADALGAVVQYKPN